MVDGKPINDHLRDEVYIMEIYEPSNDAKILLKKQVELHSFIEIL